MSLVALAVLLWDKDPGSNMAISANTRTTIISLDCARGRYLDE
jgi:hypothetical protein